MASAKLFNLCMAKKNFTSEFSTLLGKTPVVPPQQDPPPPQMEESSMLPPAPPVSDNEGNKNNMPSIFATESSDFENPEVRATFILREDKLRQIKSIAYWDRLQIKEVMDLAITHYVEQWEKENGQLQLVSFKR